MGNERKLTVYEMKHFSRFNNINSQMNKTPEINITRIPDEVREAFLDVMKASLKFKEMLKNFEDEIKKY